MRTAFLLGIGGLGGRSPAAFETTSRSLSALEDGTMTCGVPCGLDLSALPVGMQLTLPRHRPNGRLTAVAEVPQ